MSYVYLGCAIGFTATAQIFFKLFHQKRRFTYLLLTVALFGLTPFMSYLALKALDLSVVYMSTAITYVLVMYLARIILKETINRRQVYAVSLIVVGVMIFNI